MVVHGVRANLHFGGNLPFALPFKDECKHFMMPRGQTVER